MAREKTSSGTSAGAATGTTPVDRVAAVGSESPVVQAAAPVSPAAEGEAPSPNTTVTLVNLSSARAAYVPLTSGPRRLAPKEAAQVSLAELTDDAHRAVAEGRITLRTP